MTFALFYLLNDYDHYYTEMNEFLMDIYLSIILREMQITFSGFLLRGMHITVTLMMHVLLFLEKIQISLISYSLLLRASLR